MREGLEHIAEASQRDRAQLAAHEVALRSQFTTLPTEELYARREELASAASTEEAVARPRGRLEERVREGREARERLAAERRAEVVRNPEGGEALRWIETNQRLLSSQLAHREAELAEMPTVGDSARRELAVAERVLDQRRELAIIAARLDPPTYITKELGARPNDPANAKTWERGVSQIEGYRHKHGITDKRDALGREAEGGASRAARERALQRLQRTQRQLGREQHLSRTRETGRSLGMGRGR